MERSKSSDSITSISPIPHMLAFEIKIVTIVLTMLETWQNYLYPFLNSPFFVGLVTLFVGAFAYIIYYVQKRDKKRELANIILLEIQSAERKLGLLKASLAEDPPYLPNDIRLLPNENWSQHRYLYIRDFDRDEWDGITNFYDKCELIDETIKYNEAAFWSDVEQIRANKQRVLADYAKKCNDSLTGDSPEDDTKLAEFDETTDRFNRTYMRRQARFSYTPDKTLIDANKHLVHLDLGLSKSVIGSKLKKLANIEV